MTVLATIPPLKFDRSRQTAIQVFDALRELIIEVELAPGMVLPRAELAEHYGISQTPIRDALMRLGEEGLVDIFPQYATVVSRIDIPAAQQAHFLRRAVELEIVRTLASFSDAVRQPLVARLRTVIGRQVADLAQDDLHGFAVADLEFHEIQYEAVGMASIHEVIRKRSGHIDRLRSLNLPTQGKREAIVRDHRAIVDAIEAGDPAAAEQAVRTHLSGTLSFVDEVRARYPAYVSG